VLYAQCAHSTNDLVCYVGLKMTTDKSKHVALSIKIVQTYIINFIIHTAVRSQNTGLFKMIVGVLTTCHTQYTSFSRCNHMWFLSMGLRQISGLFSASSRKYPGTEGNYMLQTVGMNSIIVLMFVESQRVHIKSTCKLCHKNLECYSIK